MTSLARFDLRTSHDWHCTRVSGSWSALPPLLRSNCPAHRWHTAMGIGHRLDGAMRPVTHRCPQPKGRITMPIRAFISCVSEVGRPPKVLR